MFCFISKFSGIFVSVTLFFFVWLIVWLSKKNKIGPFKFDPPGQKGDFEKFLQTYTDIAKFVIGLASGSIVLLVGSSSFRQSGQLPSSFASPLFILTASILYGIFFMVFITLNYEAYRHKVDYTMFMYTRNLALDLSSLLCFIIGYIWLVFIVTT